MKFEWDSTKAENNRRKHDVSFELAIRAFADPLAIFEQDRIEDGKYRWQTIGAVDGCLILLVAYTIRDDLNGDEIIRIISARKATPKERKRYVKNCAIYH